MGNGKRWEIAVIVPLIMAVWVIVQMVLFAASSHTPALYVVAAAVAMAYPAYVGVLLGRDRWSQFEAPESMTFQRRETELPVVADHRDVFGAGKICNVVHGDGFVAFEMVNKGLRHWFFTMPLSVQQPAWHIRPPRYNNGHLSGKKYFLDLYEIVSGSPPGPVRQILTDESVPGMEIRCDGDTLIVTEPWMSGREFPAWLAKRHALLVQLRDLLDGTPARTRPALAPSDPRRNVWQPSDVVAPTAHIDAAPAWKQPPRR